MSRGKNVRPSYLGEQKFGVGDTVRWTSQAGSHRKTKLGVIHWVVQPNYNAFACVPKDIPRSRIMFDSPYAPHLRYLVLVEDAFGNRRAYCPRVGVLKLVMRSEW